MSDTSRSITCHNRPGWECLRLELEYLDESADEATVPAAAYQLCPLGHCWALRPARAKRAKKDRS